MEESYLVVNMLSWSDSRTATELRLLIVMGWLRIKGLSFHLVSLLPIFPCSAFHYPGWFPVAPWGIAWTQPGSGPSCYLYWPTKALRTETQESLGGSWCCLRAKVRHGESRKPSCYTVTALGNSFALYERIWLFTAPTVMAIRRWNIWFRALGYDAIIILFLLSEL